MIEISQEALGKLLAAENNISTLFKTKPGRGTVHETKKAYPDAPCVLVNDLDLDTEETLLRTMSANKGKTVIVDLDIPEATIDRSMAAEMCHFINDGGRLLMITRGEVHISSPALQSRLYSIELV